MNSSTILSSVSSLTPARTWIHSRASARATRSPALFMPSISFLLRSTTMRVSHRSTFRQDEPSYRTQASGPSYYVWEKGGAYRSATTPQSSQIATLRRVDFRFRGNDGQGRRIRWRSDVLGITPGIRMVRLEAAFPADAQAR